MDADDLMMLALGCWQQRISQMKKTVLEITTAPADFDAVHKALEEAGYSYGTLQKSA